METNQDLISFEGGSDSSVNLLSECRNEGPKVSDENVDSTGDRKKNGKRKSKTVGTKSPPRGPQKPQRLRPNHFFAIRICDDEIIETIQTFQSTVVSREPKLNSTLISLSTLHITLAVVHLENETQIECAKEVMNCAGTRLKEHIESRPLHLHFEEVGHFQNKVVYANILNHDDCLDRLNHLAAVLREECKKAGLVITDGDEFTPHLTLMKLSKDPSLWRKGIKKIHPELYEEHSKKTFGKQVTRSIQLLSMDEPKDDQGYYACRGEFFFEVQECSGSQADLVATAREDNRMKMRKLISEALHTDAEDPPM